MVRVRFIFICLYHDTQTLTMPKVKKLKTKIYKNEASFPKEITEYPKTNCLSH